MNNAHGDNSQIKHRCQHSTEPTMCQVSMFVAVLRDMPYNILTTVWIRESAINSLFSELLIKMRALFVAI